MKERNYRYETLQVHAGQQVDPTTLSCTVPLYQTTSYHFKSAEHAANLFALKEVGNIYTRLMNPTTDVFEQRVATLEGAAAAVAAASGHGAQLVALTSLLRSGDNMVSSPWLYGGSFNQFSNSLANMGIECRFSNGIDPEDFEMLIDHNTKAIYVEAISNANLSVPDFEALAELAHAYSIPLVVDNTFGCAGYVCRPIDFGADILVESATKWICGHATVMGGVIVDAGRMDWGSSGKFPLLASPSESYHGLNFWETFGPVAFALRCRAEGQRDLGANISPFNSWIMIQGLETLSLRVQRQIDTSLALARWFEAHPMVARVDYPGLESSRWHANAQKYLRNGFGGAFMVTLKGSAEDAATFAGNLSLVSCMANLGDVRTMITHPASTTHSQLSEKELLDAGISPSLVRISTGVEHIDDLIEDFEQGFAAIR
ncbi:O-acetylhomoserine (thiol)-lyase [Bacteroidia bacterium]|nr:O-acetylhomoserine (thiol)-lyase [Bacteroidia bacterium]